MVPGYEYILALIFFVCTAVAGMSTGHGNIMTPSYKVPSYLSK